MNKKNNKDVFLNAIMGTTPIKKSNKNFKQPVISKVKNQEKANNKELKTKLQTPDMSKEHQDKDGDTRFKLEKSKLNKKLKKGRVAIDRTVDLHGLTVEQARIKFIETVESCYFANKRCILFITGKGMGVKEGPITEKKLYYGKIRNEFLKWAHYKKIIRKILSVEQAGAPHGGDGAFFVYLRKNKT